MQVKVSRVFSNTQKDVVQDASLSIRNWYVDHLDYNFRTRITPFGIGPQLWVKHTFKSWITPLDFEPHALGS